ncbi:MAG: hypothetical protein ACREVZ_12650, partial [Burkholderiales bacterium]
LKCDRRASITPHAQKLLQEVVRDVPAQVSRAFASVVQAKFEYEYSGEVFTQAAAKRLLVKAERFYRWAEEQVSKLSIQVAESITNCVAAARRGRYTCLF